MAPANPKIYAELLFLKSAKEAYDIEYNYEDNDAGKSTGGKNFWSESDEQELRDLFTMNQEHPASDQDVIDWIVDHLSSETRRTRRSVMKKLRELGLVFKAPTKRSLAEAAAKFKWNKESDARLRELYDEHRQNNPLKEIMAIMGGEHTKQAVIKRMITIGLIADKSEVVKVRVKKGATGAGGDGQRSGSDSGSESEEDIDFGRLRNPFAAGGHQRNVGPKKMTVKKQGNYTFLDRFFKWNCTLVLISV